MDPTGQYGQVDRLYETVLGRSVDLGGLNYWTAQLDSGALTLDGLASNLVGSKEFAADHPGVLTTAQYLDIFYHNGLGRSVDSGGSTYWNGLVGGGATLGSVAFGISNSYEAQYDWSVGANTIPSQIDAPLVSQVFQLYQAAFDRTPDEAGANYWYNMLITGNTAEQVAQGFINSTEFQTDLTNYDSANTSNTLNQNFVNYLYQEAFGTTAPNVPGASGWVTALDNGASQASVLLGVANSQENVLDTAATTHNGWIGNVITTTTAVV